MIGGVGFWTVAFPSLRPGGCKGSRKFYKETQLLSPVNLVSVFLSVPMQMFVDLVVELQPFSPHLAKLAGQLVHLCMSVHNTDKIVFNLSLEKYSVDILINSECPLIMFIVWGDVEINLFNNRSNKLILS